MMCLCLDAVYSDYTENQNNDILSTDQSGKASQKGLQLLFLLML